ncbi:MAG: glycosyltransferase [Phycisphaerales bacterium]|nr:glycosyltransferase [Phycisphaerales bacterium]
MTRLCHLVDDGCGWDGRIALGALLERVPSARWSQGVGVVSRDASCPAAVGEGVDATRFGGLFNSPVLTAPRVSRWLGDQSAELIHAWGARALHTAGLVAEGHPLVWSCFDPALDARSVKALRLFCRRGPTGVVCGGERVRRRLVEQGVPAETCVVIRPPVDFARINSLRRGRDELRARLGLQREDRVVLIPGLKADQTLCDGVWALLVHGLIDHRLRGVVLTEGPDHPMLRHLVETSYRPETIVFAPSEVPSEAILCAADVLFLPDDGDFSTACVAWAMAAGVLVVAAAGYCIAEIIAHKHNGLLYKRNAEAGVIVAIAECLNETVSVPRILEIARGQAYEVFGLKSFVDLHLRLYDNLRAGRAIADGIADTAVVA